LQQSADELRDQRSRRGKAAAEAERRKRLAAIAKDPEKVIANVDRLVKLRSTDSYRQGAAELVELREALGIAGPARVRTVAENLRRQYPRQYRLISILREHGLLD
jgi:hypothetical protein